MNYAHNLTLAASAHPHRKAVILASGASRTYRQIEVMAEALAAQFRSCGIGTGARVLTLVRPGFDFIPALFALLRLGAVPVFIDPGMTLRNILACVAEVRPSAMVAIPLAYPISLICRRAFGPIPLKLVLSNGRIWGRRRTDGRESEIVPMESTDPAAIVFTSGSTGVPKGVEITHGNLEWQKEALRRTFEIHDDEVDLIVVPAFAAFTVAWGITAVIAPMSPTRPARASGEKLAEAIRGFSVTHSAGSPAVFERLFEHCRKAGVTLRSLRRILMTGAPVSERIIRLARPSLPAQARICTPYGATEALPLTSIGDDELLAECFEGTRSGRGTCVGRPIPGMELGIIRIVDGPIGALAEVELLGSGQIGEVIARGPGVSPGYFGRAQSNALAKIPSLEGIWHRMGDCGYLDQQDRLWFCGRKDHRFVSQGTEIFPVMQEGRCNRHPEVLRTALVAVRDSQGSRWPVLVVEPRSARLSEAAANRLKAELRKLGPPVRDIILSRRFPVDVRHNIKIDRIALGQLAEQSLRTHRWT